MTMRVFPRLPSRAFSLVEVTLALGIIAFCLVALFGLLPVGVNSNQMSVTQTAAASAAANIVADLRSTPKTVITSPPAPEPTPPPSPLFGLVVPLPGKPPGDPSAVFLREDGSIATASGKNENQNADPAQNPIFRATVTFYPPTKDANQRDATLARVLITWPAMADPDPKKPLATPARYSGAFETVVALDRN